MSSKSMPSTVAIIGAGAIGGVLADAASRAGHDVVLATAIGLVSAADARVLAWAVAQGRPVLTRDHEDFADRKSVV